jgi:hypothetical protein
MPSESRRPVDLDQFRRVIKSIEDFWFTLVVLPNPVPSPPPVMV